MLIFQPIISCQLFTAFFLLPNTIYLLRFLQLLQTFFQQQININEIVIEEALTEIPPSFFDGLGKLQSLKIGGKEHISNSALDFTDSSILSIGDFSFQYTPITSIIVPDPFGKISTYAFTRMPKLQTLDVKWLSFPWVQGNYYLLDLDDSFVLDDLTIAGLEIIRNRVLNLTLLHVFNFGGNEFANRNFVGVILPRNAILSYNAFFGCKDLEWVVAPFALRFNSESAFAGCSKLKSFFINDVPVLKDGVLDFTGTSVSVLQKTTFTFNDNIVKFIVSGNLSRIEENALSDNNKLSTVQFNSANPYLSERAFSNLVGLEHIYITPPLTSEYFLSKVPLGLVFLGTDFSDLYWTDIKADPDGPVTPSRPPLSPSISQITVPTSHPASKPSGGGNNNSGSKSASEESDSLDGGLIAVIILSVFLVICLIGLISYYFISRNSVPQNNGISPERI